MGGSKSTELSVHSVLMTDLTGSTNMTEVLVAVDVIVGTWRNVEQKDVAEPPADIALTTLLRALQTGWGMARSAKRGL